MNEKQWDDERVDAKQMLTKLQRLKMQRTKAGRRKLRLLACGCSRARWEHLGVDRFRTAVEVAERFADGHVGKEELGTAHRQASALFQHTQAPHHVEWSSVWMGWVAYVAAETCYPQALQATYITTVYPIGYEGSSEAESTGRLLCDLFRCVFGNPFRKPAFSKKWRTETVTALATGIYEERAFDRLPILADALEEAGCDDPAMLSHLRGSGPHCRGCWVLDLALGK